MYAIIRTGGKQYRVQPGDVLRVEKLQEDLGAEVILTDVLFVGGDKTYIGAPTVQNAKVIAVVTNQAKAPKVIVFKKKRRQGYRRLRGHRQLYTEIFIKSITSPEGQIAKADGEAKVFDPEKREARLKLRAENPQQKTDSEAAPKTKTKKVAKSAPVKSRGKSASAKKASAKKAPTKAAVGTKKKAAKKKGD